MVQGFPELQGIHQGLAASIFPVQPDQAFAPDQKRGDSVAIDPDPGKIPTVAQEKRPTEDVRDLKDMLIHSVHLLSHCIFRGDTIENEKPIQGNTYLGALLKAIN